MKRSSILDPRFTRVLYFVVMLGSHMTAVTVIGCRNEMYNQPKAEPLEQSLFFADSQASRPILEGTVPRDARVIGAPDAMVRDTTATSSSDSAAAVQGGAA